MRSPTSGVQVREDAPGAILDLAKSCIDYVRLAVGLDLDGEPETLSLVDHYLLTARQAVRERPELEPLVLHAVGAYFGEVVRRAFDAFWLERGDHVEEWLVCGRHAYFCFSPFGVARECLVESTTGPGPTGTLNVAQEARELVARRLDSLPQVRDDDYFLLTTRFEVLQIAAEALRAESIAAGRTDIAFDENDYDDDDETSETDERPERDSEEPR